MTSSWSIGPGAKLTNTSETASDAAQTIGRNRQRRDRTWPVGKIAISSAAGPIANRYVHLVIHAQTDPNGRPPGSVRYVYRVASSLSPVSRNPRPITIITQPIGLRGSREATMAPTPA